MALDAALKKTLLRLTPEERAEVLRLLDSAGEDLVRDIAPGDGVPEWIEAMRKSREMFAREGVTIDAVAEIRAIRGEI